MECTEWFQRLRQRFLVSKNDLNNQAPDGKPPVLCYARDRDGTNPGVVGGDEDRPLSRGRKLCFTVVIAFLFLVSLEGFLNLVWLIPEYRAYRDRHPAVVEFKEETYSQYDPELGWNHIPGTYLADFYGPQLDVTINNDGFRGEEDYLAHNPGDRDRLVVLGDSFTFGYGVDDRHAYSAVLDELKPGFQAVNMGQCGYSVGQGYLWYRRHARELDADILIFALITDNIWRMAGERTANGYGQPVFRLDNRQVVVGNQPVPEKLETGEIRFGRRQAIEFFLDRNAVLRTLAAVLPRSLFAPAGQDHVELMTVTRTMLRDLADDAREAGSVFAVVLLPELHELTDEEAAGYYQEVSRILDDDCRDRGIPFLDMRPLFQTQGPLARRFFLDEIWHHYSPAGHRFVANRLQAWLTETVPEFSP